MAGFIFSGFAINAGRVKLKWWNMKNGTDVIIRSSPETERLKIVGKRGYLMTKDILGSLYIYIPGYPNPFVLQPDEVEAYAEKPV